MKESTGLEKFITVQTNSISSWQGGTSYHLTSSLTNIVQLSLLENIFPMEGKTGIFKGCGCHLKLHERWASVCLLLGKELVVDVLMIVKPAYEKWTVFVHQIPSRELQPLEISQTCHSRFVSLFQLFLIYENKIPAKQGIKLENLILK